MTSIDPSAGVAHLADGRSLPYDLFLGGPSPTAMFTPPSADLAAETQELGRSRRARWFGQ